MQTLQIERLDPAPRTAAPPPVPAETDVVVIGGGIAGVTTALFLAEAGVRVVLCEKGVIAGEQSSRNWGWVRQMGRDPREMPLSVESLALWHDIDRRFGIDTGFRETGITYVSRTASEIAQSQGWAEQARAGGLRSHLLDGPALARHLPGIATGRYSLGLWTEDDGRAEPWRAVPQMARAAIRLGATILETCAVRGIETAGGALSAVVTERGTIRCTRAVVAGGVWSRLFLGNLGLDFPQLKIIGSVTRVEGPGAVPAMPVGGGDFAFRQRLDGGWSIALRNANIAPITPDSFRLLRDFLPTLVTSWRELSLRLNGQFVTELAMPRRWALDGATPFERIRTLDPVPHEGHLSKGFENLKRAFPAFASARRTHSWAGMIDATPDAIPAIGAIDRVPGLHICSGFSGHGFGIGPGAGRLMSEILRGVTPCVDPAPFRFDRFRTTAARAA
ncbi:NAD(P)/FAD-dependent oxidoreductase [Frigidibacter sp. MR17.24]|uniref:NAD(P)/FAD-dependent oxidoreductase n=1 Tax=Frigidibacter sp. MR17.24 TaxID=3127345 RepID=UPI003012AD54